MKILAAILVAIGIGYGIYAYSLKKMPVTDSGTAATQAISLTGVRSDMLQIGQAERGSIALNGKCSTLDELISGGSLAMSRPERDGYTYSVDCSGNNFTVNATHAPAPAGSPIRYPQLAMDQTLEIHEAQ